MPFVDPLSVAYYYLWYAGVDINAHPEFAEAATTNGHVGEEARRLREQVRTKWEKWKRNTFALSFCDLKSLKVDERTSS